MSHIGRDSQTFHNGDRSVILKAKATIDQVIYYGRYRFGIDVLPNKVEDALKEDGLHGQ